MAEPESIPQWPEPDENPFGVKVLDCRKKALIIMFWTTGFEEEKEWTKREGSDGEDFRCRQPRNATTIISRLGCPRKDGRAVPQGPTFVSESTEDPWFIYSFGNEPVFYNGQAEEVDFRVSYRLINESIFVHQVVADTSRMGSGPAYYNRFVDFLIKSNCCNAITPHPIPRSIPGDTEAILMCSLGEFGCRGLLATYEDTLAVPWRNVDMFPFMGIQ